MSEPTKSPSSERPSRLASSPSRLRSGEAPGMLPIDAFTEVLRPL